MSIRIGVVARISVAFVLAPASIAHAASSPCTASTYGMPCDPGSGNACGGVCQPDFTQAAAPMACVEATADVLASLELGSLDGIGCAPSGGPGSDCAHACSGGSCVATNATQGAACTPEGDAGAAGKGVSSVCSGACDGQGSCAVATLGCPKYGLQDCLFTACSPIANTSSCKQFPVPTTVACSDDPCMSGQFCAANGTCGGGTPISGCTLPEGDAGLSGGEGGGEPHGLVDGSAEAGASNPAAGSSSGGCSTGAGPVGSGTSAGGLLVLALVAARRARRRSR